MFKNVNNLLIWCIGLIICYIFYNVFILEKFADNPNDLQAQLEKAKKVEVEEEKKKEKTSASLTALLDKYTEAKSADEKAILDVEKAKTERIAIEKLIAATQPPVVVQSG
jgi:hypothetical protein